MKKVWLLSIFVLALGLFVWTYYSSSTSVEAANGTQDVSITIDTVTTPYQWRIDAYSLPNRTASSSESVCTDLSCALSWENDNIIVQDFDGTNEWVLTIQAEDLTWGWHTIDKSNVFIKMSATSDFTWNTQCSDAVSWNIIQTEMPTTFTWLVTGFVLFDRTQGNIELGWFDVDGGITCKAKMDNVTVWLKMPAWQPIATYVGNLVITESWVSSFSWSVSGLTY